MSTFGLTPNSNDIDKTGALNYAITNVGSGFQINPSTGRVTLPYGDPLQVYAYTFENLQIAFGDSVTGLNFDAAPTNHTYFGIRNMQDNLDYLYPFASEYTWYDAQTYLGISNFGTDLTVYYRIVSQGQIEFIADSITTPQFNYNPCPAPGSFLPYIQLNQVNALGADIVNVTTSSNLGYYVDQIVPAVFANQNYNNASRPDIYKNLQSDPNYTYTISSLTNILNTLSVPNITIERVLTLTLKSTSATVYTTGTMALADRVNWDPAGIGSGPPYVTLYNGINWVKLG